MTTPTPLAHRVLLVDDDVSVLDAFRRGLRTEPYEIVVAGGATEALAILSTQAIDVIVTDEQMPGMSGTAFLRITHADYPQTIRILLTGRASLEVAVRAINEGAVYRFLTKPCVPMELAVTIRQALQQHELMHESRRLLRTVRRQSALLEHLEPEWRGVTHVVRDEDGAIVVDEPAQDLDALLRELQTTLDSTEPRLVPGGGAARRDREDPST